MPSVPCSPEEMRAREAATWASGVEESAVIQRVGEAIASWIRGHIPERARLLVVAGKGHNGDDGQAAFRALADRDARLFRLRDPKKDLATLETELSRRPEVILDGLFGIGLDRDLSDAWQGVIGRINACRALRVAIDIPSGLDAGTGAIRGNAVRADYTLTVGAPKTGLLEEGAAEHAGYIRILDDVGLVPLEGSEHPVHFTLEGDFVDDAPPRRRFDAHKGDHGHPVIMAGSPGYHGAAVLAARGALRAGPGLVSLHTHPDTYLPVACQLQQAMVHPMDVPRTLPERCSAILAGPGLAHPELSGDWKENVRTLWREEPVPILIDASALGWLEPGRTNAGPRVLTPHAGEAARLLGVEAARVNRDPLRALQELSARFGDCWVVLKGPHTLVGRSRGTVHANTSGTPQLAQGGSGDVLAGFLTGLLARPDLAGNVGRTLRLGVWRHGVAAERLGLQRSNWIVEELPDALHA